MFSELTPHAAYQNTTIPWVPSAPAHWKIARNKAFLREHKEIVGERSSSLQLLALTKLGVTTRDMENLEGKVPATFDTYQCLEANDLIFCLFDVDETPRTVGIVPQPGMITSAYTRFVTSGVDPAFISSLYITLDDRKALRPLYTGLRKSIRTDAFLAARTPIPPIDEQAAIVKYLGHAHARIDTAIASKRKLIALLDEQNQAVIRQVVTRGINPAVPLKDSGIPWLGEIPEHWKVLRAKHLFTEFDRRSGTGLEPLLSLRAAAGLVYHDEVSATPVPAEVLARYKVIAPGQLVMNRMRAASGLFGVADVHGLVSPDYATMRIANEIDPHYYLRLFKTAEAMAEFRRRSSGLGTGEAGFMRLYTDDFGRIALPVPPLAEQMAMTAVLDRETQHSRLLTGHAMREIELLREFRARLTSDVVTGQVDVRLIAAGLPGLTEELLLISSEADATEIMEDAEDFLEGVNV